METESRNQDRSTLTKESKRFNRAYEVNRSIKEYVPFMPSMASKSWQLPYIPGLPIIALGIAVYGLSIINKNPIKWQTPMALISGVFAFGIINNLLKQPMKLLVYSNKDISKEDKKKQIIINKYGVDNIMYILISIARYTNYSIYDRKAVTDVLKPIIKHAIDIIVPKKYKHLIDAISEVAASDLLRFVTGLSLDQICRANSIITHGGNAAQVSNNICNDTSYKKVACQLMFGALAVTLMSPVKFAIKTILGITDKSYVAGPLINSIIELNSIMLPLIIIDAITKPYDLKSLLGGGLITSSTVNVEALEQHYR